MYYSTASFLKHKYLRLIPVTLTILFGISGLLIWGLGTWPVYAEPRPALHWSLLSLAAVSAVLSACQEQLQIQNKQLTKFTEPLENILTAGRIGYYQLDLETYQIQASDQFKINSGLDPGKEITYLDVVWNIIPEEREKVSNLLNDAIRNKKHYHVEYQVYWPDNSRHWISFYGLPQYHLNGHLNSIVGVAYDITSQKENEQRKDDFIGMVSHELKTPLTTLNAVVQVMNNKLRTDQDPYFVSCLDKAQNQVKKMGDIINGFLNMARLQPDQLSFNETSFCLGELMKEIIDENTMIFPEHTIALNSCEDLILKADREKIRHVVQNLISNAAKYAPGSRLIELSCEKSSADARVSVRDFGIGIPREDLQNVFTRFYRIKDKSVDKVSGFGIGLHLASEIIKRHGGKIWVESEYGKGSSFYFSLPLSSQQAM